MIRLKYLEPQGYYKLINDKPVDTDTIPLVRIENNKNEPNIYSNAPSKLTAKWLKLFKCNEEHSEPIERGTVVMVLRHRINNGYYWIFICSDLTESSTKKRGKRVFKFYNEDNVNSYNKNNAIEFIIDTISKVISLTTPKNDGEKVKYEVEMDLKEKGTFSIKDDLDNSISLNSLLGKLKIFLKNTYEITAKKMVLNIDTLKATYNKSEVEVDVVKMIKKNDGEEFYTILVDLMDTLIDSKYSDDETTSSATGSTIADYEKIKRRLKKFTE